MITWNSLITLFQRSHTWMLLEQYAEKYDVVAEKKLDFSVMAQVQDEFEHLSEVFEQDLRLGEVDETVRYCKDEECHSVLKSAVWKLLGKDDVLATKGIMVTDKEKERSASWN